ncbi:MAG: hypothetical protein HWQ41_12015 [Nostoc sp. NOS(2021)]|uniref:hypothetical protein n=1 Tax=Nostoc sp. NOS(2021) TaxID=2815407 RepID=UPI0025EC5F56|nr:hypothetical protein [Nostoc sp. NOS(2021)]MBN3895954.1 hypothetical protein [Nostoc sp. NOS(2021)]
MKRMVDIHDQGIDVIFRDNNRLDEFEWSNDDATLEDTLQQSIRAFSLLTQLWLPEYWMVEISPFVFDYPDTETENFQVSSDLSSSDFDKAAQSIQHRLNQYADSERPWSLKSIQTSHNGWNRLALPSGVRASDLWGIVDPDDNLRGSYIWRPAPQIAGQQTIWINIQDANAATHFSLLVNMTGEIRIVTSIGISFFNPENDARSPNHVIQGASLNAWQQANLALQQTVIQELEQEGWNRCA